MSVRRSGTLAGLLLCAALALAPVSARAQLNIICSVQAEWCTGAVVAFEKQTGIKVSMTQKGSGEAIAQVNAEKESPKTDVWFGGTGDPHLQAAELGLSAQYQSPLLGQLHPWAKRQWEISGQRTVGIYAGALGISYNPEVLARKKLPVPRCWSDLVKPEYKGEIQMANPASSGTAYTAIATLVQLMGEDQAFDYLKKLHANINSYPRSGTAPIKAVARGETSVSVGFIHDASTEALSGFPARALAPCEGTGYEIGSMSLVKGARNAENAKKFYDWALTAGAQQIAGETKQFQLPSNRNAAQPPEAPRFADMKLIDYDQMKYGSVAERKRLIARWEKEVNTSGR